MIVENLYPTTNNYNGLEIAGTITSQSITDINTDPLGAYYMGKLPDAIFYTPHEFTVDADSDDPTKTIIKLEKSSSPVFWGYNFASSNTRYFMSWNGSQYASNMRPINAMRAYMLNTNGTPSVQFKFFSYSEITLQSGKNIIVSAGNINSTVTYNFTNISAMSEWFNGSPIIVTINNTSYEINVSDFVDGFLKKDGLIISIAAFGNVTFSYYSNSTSRFIFPFISTKCNDRYFANSNVANISDSMNDFRIQFTADLTRYRFYGGQYTSGNFVVGVQDVETTAEFLDYIRRNGYNIAYYIDGENKALFRYTGYSTVDGSVFHQCGLYFAIDPWEAWTYLCLVNKIAIGSPNTATEYTTNYSISLFTPNNAPIPRRMVYTNYKAIEPLLRDWQKYGYDIIDNDFDPDTPGGGGGDDTPEDEPKGLPDIAGADEDMQDDATLVSPAMFITQYILSASQLRSLGENLWTSWLTPSTDVWKNFWYNFSAQADTGTCDIGAVLNFITSLKVFPFNLASMTQDYLSATDGIYIGTGHTNFLSGNTAILNTVIGYLDAGTVDVNLQHPYNDFRDYYNCSAMIFLPFCGTVQVNPVEVIGRTLHAKYYIDFQSGACMAVVLTSNGEHEYILCSKSGQIGFSIPITATNAGQLAARFAGDAVQTAGTLSGLFFNVAGNIANSAEQMAKVLAFNKTAGEGKEREVPTGMTATSALNIGKAGVDASLNLAEQAIDRLSRSAVDMPMLSGGSGCESLFQPSHVFVQIRRGKYAKPDNYPHSVAHLNLSSNPISYYKGKYSGTPSTGSNTDKGFCVFTNVDTSGLNCREDERAEIVALLESGVYI